MKPLNVTILKEMALQAIEAMSSDSFISEETGKISRIVLFARTSQTINKAHKYFFDEINILRLASENIGAKT